MTHKNPVHQHPGLVPDRNLEAVLEVAHDCDQNFNLDPYFVHHLDLVQVPSREVNRGRKVRRDQDPFQRKVVHAQNQDRGRVNCDQNQVVVRKKVDRSQDQGRDLQLVHDQDRVLQIIYDREQALQVVHVRDQDLQLAHDQTRVL